MKDIALASIKASGVYQLTLCFQAIEGHLDEIAGEEVNNRRKYEEDRRKREVERKKYEIERRERVGVQQGLDVAAIKKKAQSDRILLEKKLREQEMVSDTLQLTLNPK